MKTGRLQETIYNRSILKELHGSQNDRYQRAGAGAGSTLLRLGFVEKQIVTMSSIGYARKNLGKLGVIAAANAIAEQGGEPAGVFLQLWLPENYTERKLKLLIRQAKETADTLGMDIFNVQVQIQPEAKRPLLTVTGIGRQVTEFAGLKPGQDVIAIGNLAIEGTAILAVEQEEVLKERFQDSFLQRAKDTLEEICMVKEAAAAVKSGVTILKEAGEGGIFGALWELAEDSGVGLEIDLRKLPVRQETIEVCEALHRNPYELVSRGCLLAGCDNGNDTIKQLAEAGINAVFIGKATGGNDRIIWNEDEKRYLEPGKDDEIYHV